MAQLYSLMDLTFLLAVNKLGNCKQSGKHNGRLLNAVELLRYLNNKGRSPVKAFEER